MRVRITLRAAVWADEGRDPSPAFLEQQAAQLMEKLLEFEIQGSQVYNSSVSVDMDESAITIETTLEAGEAYPVAKSFLAIVQEAELLEESAARNPPATQRDKLRLVRASS
ncbi:MULTISPECIES: hypothetical protein [unclassified Micromonospora]|uniref:hypothetical protein n=1 Tax=unclassified Micromonospora TaxID=2617518 RepID=UPI00363FA9F7